MQKLAYGKLAWEHKDHCLFQTEIHYVLAKDLATGVYRRENLDLKGL